jgi:hypothetical protein
LFGSLMREDCCWKGHLWGISTSLSIRYTGLAMHRNSRTPISGTALSGRKAVSGRFYVPSDSFHRQMAQHLAGLSCKRKREFTRVSPAYRSSTALQIVSNRSSCSHLSRCDFGVTFNLLTKFSPLNSEAHMNALADWR